MDEGMSKMIKVQNLYHSYSNDDNYAVSDVSFEIKKGEVFGFLGPSGAGKSTTQNILVGFFSFKRVWSRLRDMMSSILRTRCLTRSACPLSSPMFTVKCPVLKISSSTENYSMWKQESLWI